MNWQPYFITIMIGLLIGIERERSHSNQSSIGLRTFILISLLGAIAGDFQNPWMAFGVTVFTFGLITLSYLNQTQQNNKNTDIGVTTEFAAGLVFCLGFIAHSQPTLAAVTGPIVAVLLFSKNLLHRFVKNIKPNELQAALFLILGGVVIINLVPDQTIDPWNIFNPKKFGFLILTLASLEFIGYLFTKIIGEKKAQLLIGLFGGLVSSTAVLISSAKQANASTTQWKNFVVSAIAAKIAALLELLLIVFVLSEVLFQNLLFPVLSTTIVAGISLLLINKNLENKTHELSLSSPLDWKGVLKLSVTLAAVLALISLAKLWLGDSASMAISFLTGLFELHGVSIANATMYKQNQLSLNASQSNILGAILASLIAKIIMTWTIAPHGSFAKVITVIFLAMAIALIVPSYYLLH